MIKSVMSPWQQSKRSQLATNGTILILVFIMAFYYVCVLLALFTTSSRTNDNSSSWNTLQYSSFSSATEIVEQLPEETPTDSPPPEPTSPYDPRKVALLVETRPVPHLPALFAHMTTVIPPEWTFKFMGSPAAIDFMRASPLIPRLEMSGKLELQLLPDNYSLSSRESISQMFTDIHLYRELLSPAEHLLVWQPDSIFCSNAPSTLNDFLEWDWIGAPWSKTAEYGGNGGLSLRRVSKIVEVLNNHKRMHNDGALEDLWLTNQLHRLPGSNMPNANISKTFSVESVWDEQPLGYHIGWLGVHHEQVCFRF